MPGVTEDVSGWIRPCSAQRDWMDAVPQKYVYRCIPLVAGNTMGWELLNPVESEFTWNGGELNNALAVRNKQNSPFAGSSHFGCGIVTWYLPFLFRTSPDLGLMVTGPANHERSDATPLDAFVRTDWLPFPFTMNWRLNRKHAPTVFSEGEPLCRIVPYPIALLEETTLEIQQLESDTGFLQEVDAWGQQRQQNVQKQQQDAARWQQTGERPTGEGVWNSQYVRARSRATGEGFMPHQTAFKCAEPVDKRNS